MTHVDRYPVRPQLPLAPKRNKPILNALSFGTCPVLRVEMVPKFLLAREKFEGTAESLAQVAAVVMRSLQTVRYSALSSRLSD